MPLPDHLQAIVNKLEKGQELTDAEELLYFTGIMGYTKEEAARMIHVAKNYQAKKTEGELID